MPPVFSREKPSPHAKKQSRSAQKTYQSSPDKILGAQGSHQETVRELRREDLQDGTAAARLLEVFHESAPGRGCGRTIPVARFSLPFATRSSSSSSSSRPVCHRLRDGVVVVIAPSDVGLVFRCCSCGGITARTLAVAGGEEDEG